MIIFGENIVTFSPMNDIQVDSIELLGEYSRTSGKVYFEFQCIVPGVEYHTYLSTEYAHTTFKLGIVMFPTEIWERGNYQIRDSGLNDSIYLEFGYNPTYGMCVIHINQSENYTGIVSFDNINSSALTKRNDILALEIDIDAGRIDNFYLNGIKQTISDPNWAYVSSWAPGSPIRPYAYLINRPYVSTSSEWSDISQFQEQCTLKLNSGSGDFKYGPSPGYVPFEEYLQYYNTDIPYIAPDRRIVINETATTTLTTTLSNGQLGWYTIRWEDTGDATPETLLADLDLDFSLSDNPTVADVTILEYGYNNAITRWASASSKAEPFQNLPTDSFRLLNRKTYYFVVGFYLNLNYSGQYLRTNPSTSYSGDHKVSIEVVPI